MYPQRFADLPEYAFPRLRKLLAPHEPGGEEIGMSIGEPRHPFPDWVTSTLAANAEAFGRYPPSEGTDGLLDAISGWLARRYRVAIGRDRLVTLNGTREGLYNVAMALCPETKGGRPVVLMPNPFYQVYAVAALSVGAEPVYVNAEAADGFLPDYAALPEEILARTALAYVCSPANPQGAVADEDYWSALLELAERHDFTVIADECYSEIYRRTPPPGALEVAARIGADPERLVSFHSLSKRSNLPGLRSGFAAGGPQSIARMRQLRAYTGAPLSGPLQAVAERAWGDEAHVAESRALYGDKYRLADEILGGVRGYAGPQAGFFLWLPVENDEAATVRLWRETGVKVLPGGYLARTTDRGNPGENYIRVAMVAPPQEFGHGLTLLRDCLYG